MTFIIGLIVSVAVMTAFVAYYLTREEEIEEESPLQKVLNKSMEKSAKDIKVKDAVVVEPRVTKVSVSPELAQFIDAHGKNFDKIQDEIFTKITQEEAAPVVKRKKGHRYNRKPKTQD